MATGDLEVGTVSLVCFVLMSAFYFRLCTSVPRKDDLTYRDRLQTHFVNSAIGQFCEVIVALTSLGSCILFVWDTYKEVTPIWMFCTELAFSWLFMYQFFLEYYMAKNKLKYLRSMQAMVDMVTVTPVMVQAAAGGYGGAAVGFLRFTRVMKVTRVFRLVRLVRSIQVLSNPIDDAITAQTVELSSALLSMVVIAAGFVQYLDSTGDCFDGGRIVLPDGTETKDCESPLAFHDAFYFSIVTLSTVGYGDMSPTQTLGRMVMCILITLTFTLLPVEMGKLATLMEMRSKYAGKAKLGKNSIHVVLCCDENCTGVDSFLQQFFHEDHGLLHSHMVVLCPSEPDGDWKSMLLKYKKRITYLKGDMVKPDDLVRAQIADAVGCFIMADRFCTDTNAQDAKNILRALTLWNFDRRINCFIQLIEPENRKHLLQVGIPASRIICHNEIKMGLMAQGVLWRGFSTFVANLLCVTTADEFKSHDDAWAKEYIRGAQQEVYRGQIGQRYEGGDFTSVVRKIYRQSGVLLIAISNASGAVLNPGKGYRIKGDDFGFMIADNHEVITRLLDPDAMATFSLSSWLMSTVRQGAHRLSVVPAEGEPKHHRGSITDDFAKVNKKSAKAVKEALLHQHEQSIHVSVKQNKSVEASPWYRPLQDAMSEYEIDQVPVSGHIVVLAPSLDDLGALLEMIRLPHLPKRAVVLVAPIHLVESKREFREMEIDWQEIMAFQEIHLVCGSHDDAQTLWRAAVSKAHSVMIFSNRAESENDDQSFVDSAMIVTALGVFSDVQSDRRVLVELNDSTVIEHFGCVTRAVVESYERNKESNELVAFDEDDQKPDHPQLLLGNAGASSLVRGKSAAGNVLAKVGSPARRMSEVRRTVKSGAEKAQELLDDAITASDTDKVHVSRQYQLNPAYLAGDVVLSNVSSLLLCQAFFNPHIIGIISILVGATMEQQDEGDDDIAKSSMVQIKVPAEFMTSAEKVVTNGLVEYKFEELFEFLMDKDVLPVALYRLGSESRDALHISIPNDSKSAMPNDSYLISNPGPEQLVGAHDLVCCLIYNRRTYEDMKLKEEPFHNSWTPFSHEGRRRSRIAMNQLEAAGKHAMGEKVNLSVATLHRTIDDLVDRNDSKTSSSTLSSDFTNLEKHVNELVETTMKSEKQVNELKHRLLLATNALKEATGGAVGDPYDVIEQYNVSRAAEDSSPGGGRRRSHRSPRVDFSAGASLRAQEKLAAEQESEKESEK